MKYVPSRWGLAESLSTTFDEDELFERQPPTERTARSRPRAIVESSSGRDRNNGVKFTSPRGLGSVTRTPGTLYTGIPLQGQKFRWL